MPRSYCLTLVAVMFFISQVVTGIINDIAHLWIASALVGLAYGSVFSLLPTVCLEWFGMREYRCGAPLPLFFFQNIELLSFFYQRTFLRIMAISLYHLLLVTSSLLYLGGTLMRTGVLQLVLSLHMILPFLNVCKAYIVTWTPSISPCSRLLWLFF